MIRRWFPVLCATAFILGAIVRVHNALTFPLMRGYDAFAHFGYLWFLADEGRMPPATAGWEFFQPPAYYVFLLAFWKGLPGVDPLWRLRLATAAIALAGIVPAWVSLTLCRRRFPDAPGIAFLAAELMLFLPVHLYSAGFLGNEGFCALLSSVALAALLKTLERPTLLRCGLLGVSLGLAMLSKFTAIVVVAAAIGSLAVRALRRDEWKLGAVSIAVVTTAMLLVSGWFYVRNVITYGNPFQMSREELFLSQVESAQLQGRRGLLEYVLFDPLILYRPQWPRGLSLDGPRPEGMPYSPIRESIPTGLYANTWFDGFGGFVLPRVIDSELARRCGQLLLTLGLVPTMLMIVGLMASLKRSRREGWDDTTVAMLLATMAMAAVIVQGTRTVPTQAAVKATYLMPVSVAFSFWFATGFDVLQRWSRRAGLVAGTACVVLALISSAVFAHGVLLSDRGLATEDGDAAVRNLHGMIYAAAGDRDHARALFESSAAQGWPLANENLADFAIDEGHLDEALQRMTAATVAQRSHLHDANPAQRAYLQATLAEYANTRAVLQYRLGNRTAAIAAAHESRGLYPRIPEAWFNLGVLLLDQSGAAIGTPRLPRVRRARRAFGTAFALDPAFRRAEAMAGVAATFDGDCTEGSDRIRDALLPRPGEHRAYPLKTGPGDQNGAGRHRRRSIDPLPEWMEPATRVAACGAARG